MMISLKANGLLTQYLGAANIPIELSDRAKLGDLIELIGQQYISKLPGYIWNHAEGRFRGPVVFSINKKITSDPSTQLKEGQIVEINLAIVGG